MADVLVALLPAAVWACWLFGWRALAIELVCVGACVASETLSRSVMKRPQTVGDLSCVVTGLLLAFNLPVSLPLWQAALGSVAAIVVAFCLLLPYGRGGTGDILLYDGDYSETQLMHHMVKMLVEDQTDLTVTIQDQMSQVNNWNSLKDDSHTCDLMISYDGTILTTFLGQDTVDVPEGMTIYDYVQGELDSYGLTQLEQLGFENTYAIGVPQALADEYGLETISDLIPIADQLTFGAEQEFFTLEGSMKYDPFVKFYGLNFQDAVSVDMGLKYSAIENGSFDVAVVYSTDGLNKKVGLKVLEDDQSFFPDYNGVFLVRDDLLEKYPEVADILNQLAGKIPTEQMAELTYQVDVEGRTVDEVAREFLVSLGLLEA